MRIIKPLEWEISFYDDSILLAEFLNFPRGFTSYFTISPLISGEGYNLCYFVNSLLDARYVFDTIQECKDSAQEYVEEHARNFMERCVE